MTKTTRTIAGHKLALVAGVRYVASRPFASRGRTEYPVTIQAAIGSPLEAETVTIDGLTYEQANRLVNAFNNGAMSFDGRVWAEPAQTYPVRRSGRIVRVTVPPSDNY